MSDVAEKAPKKNWFARHKIITGIVGILLFFWIIGTIGGSGNNSASSSKGDSSSDSKTVAKESSKPIAKIGEPVTDKDLDFTVIKITTAKALGNTYTRKDAQGTFQIINLKIANQGKETKTIDSSMFQLTDSKGRTFDRSIEGQSAKGMSEGGLDLFLQQVQPGLSVNGDIVFDIPADATGLQLIVKGSVFSSGQKIQL